MENTTTFVDEGLTFLDPTTTEQVTTTQTMATSKPSAIGNVGKLALVAGGIGITSGILAHVISKGFKASKGWVTLNTILFGVAGIVGTIMWTAKTEKNG